MVRWKEELKEWTHTFGNQRILICIMNIFRNQWPPLLFSLSLVFDCVHNLFFSLLVCAMQSVGYSYFVPKNLPIRCIQSPTLMYTNAIAMTIMITTVALTRGIFHFQLTMNDCRSTRLDQVQLVNYYYIIYVLLSILRMVQITLNFVNSFDACVMHNNRKCICLWKIWAPRMLVIEMEVVVAQKHVFKTKESEWEPKECYDMPTMAILLAYHHPLSLCLSRFR